MSRLPPISGRDLSDHADDERVERIWERLASDLPRPQRAVAPRTAPRSVLLLCAALGTFSFGVFAGKALFDEGERGDVVVSPIDIPLSDVMAAGSVPRTFALPGGGTLVLDSESTVEVTEVNGADVTLRLLRGGAAFDASDAAGLVAIIAGDARVSAPAGSVLSIRRSDRDMEVAVSRGSVDVTSADGRNLPIGRGELKNVSIVATVTTLTEDVRIKEPTRLTPTHPHLDAVSSNDGSASFEEPVVADAPIASAASPSWLALHKDMKLEEAFRVIQASGGLNAAIKNAQRASEVMALVDIARSNGQSGLTIAGWRRIADEFPSDPNAQVAAHYLAQAYRDQGNAELAAKYTNLTKGSPLEETLACSQLRAMSDGEELVMAARSYVARFPNGPCRSEADEILEDARPAGATPEHDKDTYAEADGKDDKSKDDKSKDDKSKGSPSASPSSSNEDPKSPGSAPSGAPKP